MSCNSFPFICILSFGIVTLYLIYCPCNILFRVVIVLVLFSSYFYSSIGIFLFISNNQEDYFLFSMEGETIKMMNQDLVRLDRFDGTNFTRWQDKVSFLLTTLKISYILESTLEPLPATTDKDTDEVKAQRKKREDDNLLCR